jgi:hypothetical protein
MKERYSKLVERHYSLRELSVLFDFTPRWWREQAQAGELVVRDESGQVLAEPVELAGELRIPASCVNAFLARRPFRYDAGIAARNRGELLRKLRAGEATETEAQE